MRATTFLPLIGAVARVVANEANDAMTVAVPVADGQETAAVVLEAAPDASTPVAHINTTVTVDWLPNDSTATPEPEVTEVEAEAEPEHQTPVTHYNTTLTVDWIPTDETDTPMTPLPTDEAETPTDTDPAEVTGGAIPQPMKASAAGLLGFFIMGLVML